MFDEQRARRISFALALLIAALWLRSYAAGDRFFWQFWKEQPIWTFWTQDEVQIGHGAIGFNRIIQGRRTVLSNGTWRQETESQFHTAAIPFHRSSPADFPDFKFRSNDDPVLGFKLGHFINGTAGANDYSEGWQIVVPLWMLLLLMLVLPAVWYLLHRRAQRRFERGHCAVCGYDMRATPDRCPECGQPAATSTAP
jgi:hypothetical protein